MVLHIYTCWNCDVISCGIKLFPWHCFDSSKMNLDLCSYFDLFWETSRHNTVQRWNNNADSVECSQAETAGQVGLQTPSTSATHGTCYLFSEAVFGELS